MYKATTTMTAQPYLLSTCASTFTSERGAKENLYLIRDTYEQLMYNMTNGRTFAQIRATLPPDSANIDLILPEEVAIEKYHDFQAHYRYWCTNICKLKNLEKQTTLVKRQQIAAKKYREANKEKSQHRVKLSKLKSKARAMGKENEEMEKQVEEWKENGKRKEG